MKLARKTFLLIMIVSLLMVWQPIMQVSADTTPTWDDVDHHFTTAFDLLKSKIKTNYSSYYRKVNSNSDSGTIYSVIRINEEDGLTFTFNAKATESTGSTTFSLTRRGSCSDFKFSYVFDEQSGFQNANAYATLDLTPPRCNTGSGTTYTYTFTINKEPNCPLTDADLNNMANQSLSAALATFNIDLSSDFGLSLKDIYFYNYGNDQEVHRVNPDAYYREPTCTEDGEVSNTYCTICGAVKAQHEVLPALGHDLVFSYYSEPSCTEAGYIEYDCKRCYKTIKDPVPATGHEFGDWLVDDEATCEYGGKEYRECKHCGIKENRSTPKTGHSFSEWKVDEEATCEYEGVEHRECKECGYQEDRSIPKTDHKWDSGEVIKKATTKSEGEKLYTCTVCGREKRESIPKLDSSDGTAIGEGASIEDAEAAITSAKTDKDLKGSIYHKLQVQQSKATKTSITVKWNKISGAKKYVVYAGKSGKSNNLQKVATITKTNYTLKKFNKKALTKGTYYKFAVVAVNSKGKVVTASKFAHVATLGKNAASNPAKVTTKAKKDKVTVKVKKTFQLAGSYASSAKKYKIKKILGMRYESTDTKIATVSAKGVIKGVKKGTCYVYAYAQNGMAKKIKVTVK